MKIKIVPELTTSNKDLFAFPYISLTGSQQLKRLCIPIQQRQYDWGNPDNKDRNIEELLEDIEHFIVENSGSQGLKASAGSYFAGAIILEQTKKDELKVIDGQQRVTTIFIMNYLCYLLARFRLTNIPTIPDEKDYGIEFKTRFDSFIKYEQRVFITDASIEIRDFKGEKELLKRIGEKRSLRDWKRYRPRIFYADKIVENEFINQITHISLQKSDDQIVIKSTHNGFYINGLRIILDHLKNVFDNDLSFDEMVGEYLSEIDDYLGICGFASIVSENSDDSFRLFEILNARGHDLSALDLVKNIILERFQKGRVSLKDFTEEWSELRDNVNNSFSAGKADSTFVEFILRSEGSDLRSREISYLNNKIKLSTKKPAGRHAYFVKNETIVQFWKRIQSLSEITVKLKSDQDPLSPSFSKSAYQNTLFMRLMSYNWGPQVIAGANLMYLKLDEQYTQNFLQSKNHHGWTVGKTDVTKSSIDHFLRFLSDILLKIGIVGIVNGLSSSNLPKISRLILQKVIDHIYMHPDNYSDKEEVKGLMKSIIIEVDEYFCDKSINKFKDRLSSKGFIANSQPKRNLVKVILYIIYNQNGITYDLGTPDLEHLEPVNPVPGTKPYYSELDRDDLIQTLGNFALIPKDINRIEFSNKPLVEKLKLVFEGELGKKGVFSHPLFKTLNFKKKYYKDGIYGELPDLENTIVSNTPQRDFFTQRGEHLAGLAAAYICNGTHFLDSSDTYI